MPSDLYDGKFFYEIVRTEIPKELTLVGPLYNIYYVSPLVSEHNEYKFVQVINGKPVVAFRENEILVTDHIL